MKLTRRERDLLCTLDVPEPVASLEAAKLLNCAPSNLGRLVSDLEGRGLVCVQRAATRGPGRPQHAFALTQSGRQIAESISMNSLSPHVAVKVLYNRRRAGKADEAPEFLKLHSLPVRAAQVRLMAEAVIAGRPAETANVPLAVCDRLLPGLLMTGFFVEIEGRLEVDMGKFSELMELFEDDSEFSKEYISRSSKNPKHLALRLSISQEVALCFMAHRGTVTTESLSTVVTMAASVLRNLRFYGLVTGSDDQGFSLTDAGRTFTAKVKAQGKQKHTRMRQPERESFSSPDYVKAIYLLNKSPKTVDELSRVLTKEKILAAQIRGWISVSEDDVCKLTEAGESEIFVPDGKTRRRGRKSSGELRILELVSTCTHLSDKEIAKELNYKRSIVSRHAESLEAKGLVSLNRTYSNTFVTTDGIRVPKLKATGYTLNPTGRTQAALSEMRAEEERREELRRRAQFKADATVAANMP